jgi:hypothetical protein
MKLNAKEKHKNEIKDAWDNGAYGGGEFMINIKTSDEYYEEIFN